QYFEHATTGLVGASRRQSCRIASRFKDGDQVLSSRASRCCVSMSCLWFVAISLAAFAGDNTAQSAAPKFHVIALAEVNSIHRPFVDAAKVWLQKQAIDNNFSVDYIENTDKIDEAFLSHYQLFIQLDYPPYAWKPQAVAAFTKYIEEGRGGWIGFHHATLLGEFDGFPMWQWFSKFMGDTRYKNYIATFVKARVNIEDKKHPVMKGVSPSFMVEKEEFYTYEKSMRPNVHVLASVDESTYEPNSDIKMG